MKIQTIEKLFYLITAYSYLLLPLGALVFYRKGNNKVSIIIALYGLICIASLLYFLELPRVYRKYYYTFYTTFEYSLFTYLIYQFTKSHKAKKVILILSFLFLVFQVLYLFYAKKSRLDSVPIGIETILVFAFIIYTFLDLFKKIDGTIVYSKYIFWISIGILLYLGGSFFFYILVNHLTEQQYNTFVILASVSEIIKNVLFVISIYIYKKQYGNIDNKKHPEVPFLDMI